MLFQGSVGVILDSCESGSESESTRPESESIRPESESIMCESESIGPESESESIRPESESESSGSESKSESVSPTEVRVSPDLSPDSTWTHESNNRKVLCFNPTFNHFCWALYCNLNFPLFLLTYRENNRRKHIGSNHSIVLCNWYQSLLFSLTNHINKKKESLFQKVVIQNSLSKRSLFQNLQFYINIWLFGVKTVQNNYEPSEYRPTYMPFEGELSKLLATLLLVLLIYI